MPPGVVARSHGADPFVNGLSAAAAVASQDLPVSDYLLHCERRLGDESDRCTSYLDASSTRRPLLAVLERELVEVHAQALLDK